MKNLTLSRLGPTTAVVVALSVFGLISPHSAQAASPSKSNPFCDKLGKSIQASQGAQMFCFGPQSTGSAQASAPAGGSTVPSFGANVDAATLQEDVTPSGVQVLLPGSTSSGRGTMPPASSLPAARP